MYEESIKAALELVDKYREITLEDLKVYAKDYEDEEIWKALSEITGFGYNNKCSLCVSVNRRCDECIHSLNKKSSIYMTYCIQDETFNNIYDACTYEELLDAIKKRADYIEEILNKIKNDNRGTILQNNSSE